MGVLALTSSAQVGEHLAQVANSANGHNHRDDEESGPGHYKIENPEIVPGFHGSTRLVIYPGGLAIRAGIGLYDITFRIS